MTMTALPGPSRRQPLPRPTRLASLLACAGLVAVVVGAQATGLVGGRSGGADERWLEEPLRVAPPAEGVNDATTGDAAADPFDPRAELDRVRADVDFWANRLQADRVD